MRVANLGDAKSIHVQAFRGMDFFGNCPTTPQHILLQTEYNPKSRKFPISRLTSLLRKLNTITALKLLRMLYLGVADSGEGPVALYGVVLPRTDRLSNGCI